jgi:hypothetical protein
LASDVSWAKNVVTVGGVKVNNSTNRSQHGRPETPCPPPPEPCTFDVDFALVVSGIVPIASIDPGSPRPPRFCTLAEFLEAFLEGDADVDDDGATGGTDWFEFLDGLFAGTPCTRK